MQIKAQQTLSKLSYQLVLLVLLNQMVLVDLSILYLLLVQVGQVVRTVPDSLVGLSDPMIQMDLQQHISSYR